MERFKTIVIKTLDEIIHLLLRLQKTVEQYDGEEDVSTCVCDDCGALKVVEDYD